MPAAAARDLVFVEVHGKCPFVAGTFLSFVFSLKGAEAPWRKQTQELTLTPCKVCCTVCPARRVTAGEGPTGAPSTEAPFLPWITCPEREAPAESAGDSLLINLLLC